MNILILGPSRTSMGGIATVINNMYQYYDDESIKLRYLSTWSEGVLLKRIIQSIIIIPQFIFILLKYKIKVIHVHVAQKGSFFRKSILILLGKLLNKKIIFHIHASSFDVFYNDSNKIVKIYINNIMNISDKIIVLSEEWKKIIEKITNNKNILVLPNAVKVYDNSYNFEGNIITFIGRLCSRKGIYDLLDILDSVIEKHNNVKFYLCGDGDVEAVKNIILKMRYKNNIIVTGWISNEQKEDLLKNTIINILPSYHEGMPMSILETMAKGIPNISTNIGGIPRVIKHKNNGLIVMPGDKRELQNSINFLIENVDLRVNFSNAAHTTIKKEYSIKTYNKKLTELYLSVIN